MKVEGSWAGFYEFGLGYSLPPFGERVKFELTIIGNEDGFSGVIKEEESAFSTKEQTEIHGFFSEGMISFVKTYRANHFVGEEKVPESVQPIGEGYEVRYSGGYSEKNDSFYGIWELTKEFDINGKRIESVGEGIWIARRK